jgi:hypothetical protein
MNSPMLRQARQLVPLGNPLQRTNKSLIIVSVNLPRDLILFPSNLKLIQDYHTSFQHVEMYREQMGVSRGQNEAVVNKLKPSHELLLPICIT